MDSEALKSGIANLLEERINKACFLKQSKRNMLLGEYVYPCEQDRLLDSLRGENGVCKVNDYFFTSEAAFSNKHEQFVEIMDNGHFNPYLPFRASDYFVETRTYNELNILFDLQDNENIRRNVIHVGEKGSGKTTTQKCWLYRFNEELAKRKIFWVRCDGYKLYNLWLEHHQILTDGRTHREESNRWFSESRLVGIDQYLKIQLVYVFAKYCTSQERIFFREIREKLKNSNLTFDLPKSRRVLNDYRQKNLFDYIEELRATIEKEEKNKETGYSYAVDHVMKISLDSQQLEKRKWLKCAEAFENFLFEEGYWILKIVDGLDNVHINDDASVDYYHYMLRKAFKFIKKRPEKKQLHFMALRERTLIDIINQHPLTHDTKNYIEYRELTHEAPEFKSVIEKRFDYAKEKLFNESDLYCQIASKVVNSTTPNINTLHHNNARAFLYNKMSLITQVYYRIKQLGGMSANIESQINTLRRRNLFLNGRLYLNTRKQWHELNFEPGVCSMNIFYSANDKYQQNTHKNWLGLIKTRILQLLDRYNRTSRDQLTFFLAYVFDYPENLLIKNVKDLCAFGYIDSIFDEEIKCICYFINDKGRDYLENSYTDLDTFYYFALDSLLPKTMLEEELVNAHENKFHKRTNYPYACISTSITFLLFLLCVNREESNRYNKKKKLEEFESFNMVFDSVSLPFQQKDNYQKLLDNIHQLIDNSDDIDRKKVENYLVKLDSLIYKKGETDPNQLAN